MHIARFDGDRLGIVENRLLFDVSHVLSGVASQSWPLALGDPLIRVLPTLRSELERAKQSSASRPISDLRFNSPVSWATKIMAAPANYRKHVEIDTLDPGVDQGVHRAAVIKLDRPVDTYGLFLKASSSLVGEAEGIVLGYPDRRCDHEVELAVIIGRTVKNVAPFEALNCVAGYSVGLDITVRGAEDRSFRKSADSFAVLGPWLTTADSVSDPQNLRLWLDVNGKRRQDSSTAAMTVGIAELISIASHAYTLYPGDILLTGTPEGVGPLAPGDIISVGCEQIGVMTIDVRAAETKSS